MSYPIHLEFIDLEERSSSSRQSIEDLRESLKDFTGARLVIDKQEEGPPTGRPINIEISGEDFEVGNQFVEMSKQDRELISEYIENLDPSDDLDDPAEDAEDEEKNTDAVMNM